MKVQETDLHSETFPPDVWLGTFLNDRRARNVSPGSIGFYRKKPKRFSAFLQGSRIMDLAAVIPPHNRLLLFHAGRGRQSAAD